MQIVGGSVGFLVGFFVLVGLAVEGLGVLDGLHVRGLVGGLVPQVGLKVGGGQVGGSVGG
jgi:hypothetical protein